MERIKVKSSNIKSVGYYAEDFILEVEFKKSGIYRYTGVPIEVYENLIKSKSKGLYFAQFILNNYPCKKINKIIVDNDKPNQHFTKIPK